MPLGSANAEAAAKKEERRVWIAAKTIQTLLIALPGPEEDTPHLRALCQAGN